MGNCGASNAGERPRVDKKSRPESPPKPTQQQAPKEKEPNAVLTAAQKQQLARETHFTLSEIDVLVSHYGYLSASMYVLFRCEKKAKRTITCVFFLKQPNTGTTMES